MATENQRLVTEAKLKTTTAGIIENPTTGRRALVFPTGTVEVGDTGWVDARGLMVNGWAAGSMRIRRQANTTRIRFSNLDATAATSSYFIKLPYGYGANDGLDYPFALANLALTVWTNGRALSIPIASNLKSSQVAEIVIPVDVDPWPTDLGGPKL